MTANRRNSDEAADGGFDGPVFRWAFVVISVIVVATTALAFAGDFFRSQISSGFLQSSSSSFSAKDLRAKAPFRTVSSSSASLSLIDSSFSPDRRRPSNAAITVNDIENGLSRARAAIRQKTSPPENVAVEFYHDAAAFHRSYIEMEKRFKVYVYEEGELPLVHEAPLRNIYGSEGRFMEEMEHGVNRFRTRDPNAAHAFYMPFGVAYLVKYLFDRNENDITPLKKFVSDYIRFISIKYPFWNRTMGADHFMVSCHDWGPEVSRANPFLFNTSIRVVCNANTSEGFNPRKDVTLPEVHTVECDLPPKLQNPPPPNTPRPILGFFAGGNHGHIRSFLLQHWKERDPDLRVHEYLPKGVDYYTFMLQSKFCLCPSGYEVASPRVVEAIYTECVPVILKDHYVLPFSDVLNWEAFSLQVEVSKIPRLKEVLMAIPEDKYLRLKAGVRAVRKHFLFNQPAQRFDVFHMIMHSIWLRRINLSVE